MIIDEHQNMNSGNAKPTLSAIKRKARTEGGGGGARQDTRDHGLSRTSLMVNKASYE